jgi:hypothetical protein
MLYTYIKIDLYSTINLPGVLFGLIDMLACPFDMLACPCPTRF